MKTPLTGKRIAILATDGFEQVELSVPRDWLIAAGAKVDIVSLRGGHIQGSHHMDKGDRFSVDRVITEVSAAEYDGLVLPGGVHNPDALRQDEHAVEFVRDFFASGTPVASICHGPWMLVEAGVLKGRTLTSWPSIRTDIQNAGGTWVDEDVHCDRGLVTSRKPNDLPAFCDKAIEEFAEGTHLPGSRGGDSSSIPLLPP